MMQSHNPTQRARAPKRRRASFLKLGVAATTLAFAATFAAIALASSSVSVDAKSSSTLGQHILVSSEGRTLYVLSPETSHHLLCTSAECLKFWPPLTVSSSSTKLKDGSGVHGKLALLHRSNGRWQVTINGLPLYFFALDKSAGDVKGQNFKSFGGVWHVLTSSGSPSSKALPASHAPAASAPAPSPAPTPAPEQSMPSSGYGY
jgi:predicted lipoprotein with Yx(FWY)xxD motif